MRENSDAPVDSDTDFPPGLMEQAGQLESILPRLARRLFSMERDHPAEELPLAQLRVCTILQAGPKTLSAISEELGISVSATTQIADRLEKSVMVERVACQEDRRTKWLQLSSHGQEMMHSRRKRRIERAAYTLMLLPPEHRDEAMRYLHVLMEAVEAMSAERLDEEVLSTRQ